MAEILIVPVGAVDKSALRALAKAGVIVVQTDQPERCQLIRSSETVSHSDMLWAAMSALQKDGYAGGKDQREEFTKLIFRLVDTSHKTERAPDQETP